jgi:hypothetical protein
VPTGAAAGLYIGENPDNPISWSNLYLWYATAMATEDAASYLACSNDGVVFFSCSWPYHFQAQRFSQDEFVFVSPILVMGGEIGAIDAADSCTLCKLKRHLGVHWFGYGYGMLLFGARGGPQLNGGGDFKGYRESPLFLAYLDIQSNEIWYFTGTDWSQSESDAQPILSDPVNQLYWFGEFSVKRVHQFDTIIMLSNHPGQRVAYRTASLLNPDVWSEPLLTCAVGYGPYIIDEYTQIEYGSLYRLIAYHTISSWNGLPNPRLHEPYGVFTTQLRLRQDPTDPNSACGEAPIWPP